MRSAVVPVIGIREPGALDFVQTLLRQGVAVRILVSGSSMRPLLNSGETVEIAPFAAGSIPKLGDILFLRTPQGNPVVHRLIWRRNRNHTLYLLTKGDACPGFDGFVPTECAVGRVERIIDRTEKTVSLQVPFMRLRALLIVSRALSRHALCKLRRILLQ